MTDHDPIDDSAADRERIWAAVAQRLDSDLVPLEPDTNIMGKWDVDFELFGKLTRTCEYDFEGSNVLVTMLDGATRSDHWRILGTGRILLLGFVYHAATLADGRLVLFSVDPSILMVATQQPDQ